MSPILNNSNYFGEASATAEFCMMINQAFDILNSRSQFSKSPFNISINLNTINKYEEFSKRFKNYIGGLTFCNGQKIVDSNRNTGFIGLILSLESAINLFKYLHYNHLLKYLLTYKISQDHLENYFSAMRSMFEFNNNPNCQQTDHDYIKTVWKLNRYMEDVSVYIGGFVVRKLLKRINCSVCSSCIQNSDTDNYLINIKNRGSLIKPSKDVELLCKETEKCIRQHQTIVFKQKNIVQFLKDKVKIALYEVVFKNEEMY